MKIYFCLVDNLGYGFLNEDENIEKRGKYLIEVTEEKKQELLTNQFQYNTDIVSFNNEVFNAPRGQYVLNEDKIFVKIDDEEYEKEQTEKRKKQFNKDFFNTSLGYIRRKVTMANGDTKDFLSDLLPTIAMGVNLGQEVKVIAYYEPDFTKDVEDWTIYQHNEIVNAQFIQECFVVLSNDFGTVKTTEI